MSFLDLAGALEQIPLAAVLVEVLDQRATGVLHVGEGERAFRVFLRDGLTVAVERGAGATSPHPREQARCLSEVVGVTSGRFWFDASAPVPAWAECVHLAPLKPIVDALERPQAVALVVAALQPAAGSAIALAPGYRQVADGFAWGPIETALVERLTVLTTLDAFFDDPGVSPERARAVLAALLLLGLATARAAPDGAVDPVPGLVVDLADLAGVPVAPGTGTPAPRREQAPPPGTAPRGVPARDGRAPTPPPLPPQAASPASPSVRRSDPEEARRRRQRLLHRAMENLGLPFAPQGRAGPPGAGREPPPSGGTAAEGELRRALLEWAPRAALPDLFARLGVDRGASREQVKAAYLHLVKQLHPDRFAAPGLADVAPLVKDVLAALNEAYAVLRDDRARADYLARTEPGRPARPGAGTPPRSGRGPPGAKR